MRLLFVFAALLGGLAGPASAQALSPAQRQEVVAVLRDALKADPSILRDALAALQADDTRRQEAVTRDVLALLAPKLVDPADPVAGNPLGDVTVIEFYDTRCPYCRRMMPATAELLRIDPNVKLVFKDLPILGPVSRLESMALLAAQRQGGYFQLQALLLGATAPSTRDSVRADAERAGLDGGRLLRDLDDPAIRTKLDANLDIAHQLGIEGTPALVIGHRLIPGAMELPELQRAIADARAGR